MELKFTKIRDVQSPTRWTETSSWIDFYIPRDLKAEDIKITPSPERILDVKNFVTEEEYAKRKFLTSVDFNVASGEVWRYGIENQDFPKLGIIVSNMYAVDALFSRRISPTNVNITVIYLNVTEKEILKRDKGDRLSQAGDDVMLRVKRDIDKNNQIFEKWEDCIHEIWCDDLSFEEVLDCVYYAIKEDECF